MQSSHNRPKSHWNQFAGVCWVGLFVHALTTGCWQRGPNDVVVYTALDREFSKPLLDEFQRQTQIVPIPKFDVESTKTVGLTQALIAEANRPRCDVFWNNEILNTIRLQKRGLLLPYQSSAGQAYPQQFRDPDGHWYGFAARARILIVNTDRIAEADYPRSIRDLTDDRWNDQVGIAKPLFGTTATHATVLFHLWGQAAATEFFTLVQSNAKVLSGNKQVALSVASGQLAWGITDTDDANVELLKGSPVSIVYPDQSDGAMGTLFIPNTIAIIAGGPNPTAARQLVEYVLSPSVEQALAQGPSAQIPLNRNVNVPTQVSTLADVRPVEVDFQAAAESWEVAAPILRDLFFQANQKPSGRDRPGGRSSR